MVILKPLAFFFFCSMFVLLVFSTFIQFCLFMWDSSSTQITCAFVCVSARHVFQHNRFNTSQIIDVGSIFFRISCFFTPGLLLFWWYDYNVFFVHIRLYFRVVQNRNPIFIAIFHNVRHIMIPVVVMKTFFFELKHYTQVDFHSIVWCDESQLFSVMNQNRNSLVKWNLPLNPK